MNSSFDPGEDPAFKYFVNMPNEIKSILSADSTFEGVDFSPSYWPQYFYTMTKGWHELKLMMYNLIHIHYPISSRHKEKKDVIFYDALSDRSAAYFGTIPERLSKDYKICFFRPTYKNVLRRFIRSDHSAYNPLDFVDKEVKDKLNSAKEYARKKFIVRESEFKELLKGNKYYSDQMRLLGVSYKYLYPISIAHYLLWQNIIKELNPKIMITNELFEIFEYSATLACKNKKVKTIGVQHGIALPSVYKLKLKREWPDILFVWGNRAKRELSSVCKNNMIVVGPLRYDNMSCSKLSSIPGRNVLFWPAVFISNIEDLNKKIFRELCIFLEKNKEWSLIVKSHPGFGEPDWFNRELSSRNDKRIILINKHLDSFSVLNSCDLVIAYNTTVFLEAIIAKKPAIFYDQPGYVRDLAEEYGFPIVSDASSLFSVFKKEKKSIVYARKRFLEDNLSNLGHASESAADFICKELKRR